MEDPSHLTRGYEGVYLNDDGQVAAVDPHIVRVETNRKKANDGLSMILQRPPGIVGEAAFNHQGQFCQRAYANKEIQHKISVHLMCSPRNHRHKSLMGKSYHLNIQCSLMTNLNEGVSLQKAAQVRLGNFSQIRNQSTFINYP